MRTPFWEAAPGALNDFFLQADQVRQVDLLTLTLPGPTVVRWHAGEEERITLGTSTWTLGPLIERGRTRLVLGVEVSTMPLSLHCGDAVTVNAQPLPAFAIRGGLDNARVRLDKVFSAGPGQPWIGAMQMFQGRASDIQCNRHTVSMTVKSDLELLNVAVPRNVYQSGCLNTLYDASCQVARSAWALATTAAAATDEQRVTFPTAAALVANRYALGWAKCLSGANAGVLRTVRSNSAGAITAIAPWPYPVAPGDSFELLAGCDKTQATCQTKFNNLVRFRGQPYIPPPETVA